MTQKRVGERACLCPRLGRHYTRDWAKSMTQKKRTNGLGMSTAIYLEGQAERAAEGRADHEDNTNDLHPCAFRFILRAGWAGRLGGGRSGRHIISMGCAAIDAMRWDGRLVEGLRGREGRAEQQKGQRPLRYSARALGQPASQAGLGVN
ncbi:unnamed protein product [Calypogeia fissa]